MTAVTRAPDRYGRVYMRRSLTAGGPPLVTYPQVLRGQHTRHGTPVMARAKGPGIEIGADESVGEGSK